MSYKKMLQGAGAPSFCYHCGKQLQRAPGKGLGLFYFWLVKWPDINFSNYHHRVHGDCLSSAIQSGMKKVPDGVYTSDVM